MTPIEIIQGKFGGKILTGATETDLSSLFVVGIVIRSPGATIAKLEVDSTDVVTARGLASVALDATDIPIMAGYDIGARKTKKFNKIQLTSATDSVWLLYGE